MFDKPDSLHTLGFELDCGLLKGAQLSVVKGKPKLEQVFEIDVSLNSDHVNPLYINDSKQSLKDLLQKNLVVTPLNTNEVLIRQLEIKLKKEKDIDAVLNFQTEPLLPYSIENAIIDRIKIGPTTEGTLLTVAASRKDHLTKHLEHWHSLQIEPEVISCIPAALISFVSVFAPSENPQFILHLGCISTTCVLVRDGKLIAAQSLQKGLNQLKEAFSKDLQTEDQQMFKDHFDQLNFESLNSIDTPALFQACEILKLDITRTLYSLAKQAKGKDIAEIVWVGEGVLCRNLSSFLCQSLNKKIREPSSNTLFPISTTDLQKFSVSIGCALSALPIKIDQINFRQHEFAYPHPWKRFKKPLSIYLSLCFLLAFAFYIFGQAYIGYQEDKLKEEYADLLVLMNKPYHSFEEEYALKFPSGHSSEEGKTITLKMLNNAELINRIRYLDKELQATPDMFALQPNVPRVSDVLAWLSKQPTLRNKDTEGSLVQPIQIDSLSYTMVKRPEQTKKQEKYQIKLEIEFTSPTPKQAREFHDALIAPNDFVDPKGEVKWSSNRGKYRTSFFLKDKTIYPSSST